jgi:hypothetical protein
MDFVVLPSVTPLCSYIFPPIPTLESPSKDIEDLLARLHLRLTCILVVALFLILRNVDSISTIFCAWFSQKGECNLWSILTFLCYRTL